jgi:Tol biopolymer transport system component
VSQRASVDERCGEPENLGAPINSEFNEFAPSLTIDGHRLFFQSNRPGGFGGFALHMSRRRDKRDNFAWTAPVNLGGTVNSDSLDARASLSFDGTELYFQSPRPGGFGAQDLYVITRCKH